MQKTFRLLLASSAILLAILWFAQWSKIRTLNSGEVHLRVDPQTTPTQPSAATSTQPAPPQEVASNQPGPSPSDVSQSQTNIASLPASETFNRTPPNGIVAAGSGKFQLYRQGDITYRLDTANGRTCVMFATYDQWRKPLVYDHGCANQ